MPKVSVLVAVYNGEDLVARALDSIRSQTFRDFETIVVDDGSTDSTAGVVRDYPEVRLIEQENTGIGMTRRRLVEESNGEWLAFLDHDDYWSAEKLAQQIELANSSGCVLIHTSARYFDETGKEWRRPWKFGPETIALDYLLPENRIVTSSTLLRKAALVEVGNFPSDLDKAEDYLTWFGLASVGDFRYVARPLTHYFVRACSASRPGAGLYRSEIEVLKERVRPRFNELFERYAPRARSKFKSMLDHKIGVAYSLLGAALDASGDRTEARACHREAIRLAPTKGAFLRMARHYVHLK